MTRLVLIEEIDRPEAETFQDAIAVAERQSYIGRIRDLTKMCAEAWVANEGGNA